MSNIPTTYKATDLEKMVMLLNQQPPEAEIKVNVAANNSKYLPISFVEMKLDELFMGLWQTRNFTYQVVANEIIGHIELGVYHPLLKKWIWRTGGGATMIQQVKGSSITDIGAKIKNTLVKDFPHFKAECIKNAAKSLGKAFGRDLNREFEDTYQPISDTIARMEDKTDGIMQEIAEAQLETLPIIQKKYAKVPGATDAIIQRRKALENGK